MFKINLYTEKRLNLERPTDLTSLNIVYPLIEPYAYAHIYFDKNTSNIIYEVVEPPLNEKEKEIYNIVSSEIKHLLIIKLSELKDINQVISYLERLYNFILSEYGIKINDENSYNRIFYYIFRDIYGYYKIEPLMRDPYIEDIECSGSNIPVFVVHRIFGNLKTNIVLNEEEIINIIEKFTLRAGKHISYAEPLLDATLPDGSRINATYSKDITTRGPTFTIRKFRDIPWSPIELIKINTAIPEIFAYLWLAVEYKKNIIIIGGTASGKTTFLNAISMFIPHNARVVSIEDTREIKLYHPNWIPSVVRSSSSMVDEISMFDLLKLSFRQRPDYVIVGEVRGEEAYVMFQGMASGHAALSTMHSTDVKSLINRLVSPPINLSKYLVELLNVVIIMRHDVSFGKNFRRVGEIDEIIRYNKYNRVFVWDAFKKRYIFNKKSYLLYKISKEYGIKYSELYKELIIRSKLLRRLLDLGVYDYETFSQIVNMYYLNKEEVLRTYKIEF